ncbi:hypothetical protein KQI84_17875 [bacterium]|nr:hypothetical protein [bacterium]
MKREFLTLWSSLLFVLLLAVSASAQEVVHAPTLLDHPAYGFADRSTSFTAQGAFSSLGHELEYRFDWGDGSEYSNWTGADKTHKYKAVTVPLFSSIKLTEYDVRTQARCIQHTDIVSGWVDSVITIESNRCDTEDEMPEECNDVDLPTLRQVCVGDIHRLINEGRANEGITSDDEYIYTSRGFSEILDQQELVISKIWPDDSDAWVAIDDVTIDYDSDLKHIGDIGVSDDYVYAPVTDFVVGLFRTDRSVKRARAGATILNIANFDKRTLEFKGFVDFSDKIDVGDDGDIAGVDVTDNTTIWMVEYQPDEDSPDPRIFTYDVDKPFETLTSYPIKTYDANGILLHGAYAYVASGRDKLLEVDGAVGSIDVYDADALSTDTMNVPAATYSFCTPEIHAEGIAMHRGELWHAQVQELHQIERPEMSPDITGIILRLLGVEPVEGADPNADGELDAADVLFEILTL